MQKRNTQFFGLQKAAVNTFLKKLEQSYEEDLNQSKDELKDLQRKKTELDERLLNLKAELFQRQSSDVLTKATAGLPLTVEAIQTRVAKETDDLKVKAVRELQDADQVMAKLKHDIQKGTRLIETFIQQFSRGIEDLGQLPESLIGAHSTASVPYIDDSLVELPLDEQSIQMEVAEPNLAGFSSFWEGSERLLAQPILQRSQLTEIKREKKSGGRGSFSSEKLKGTNQRFENEEKGREEASLQKAEMSAPTTGLAEEELKQPSEGIKQEIDLIKRRYIVGKIAGSTMYSQDGNVILKKGQPITDEAVDQANETGQLSELIVHMRIPGLGE